MLHFTVTYVFQEVYRYYGNIFLLAHFMLLPTTNLKDMYPINNLKRKMGIFKLIMEMLKKWQRLLFK